MSLGERITICRKSRGLSQMELAVACGWENQGRINNYEKNRREPTLSDIEKIASALHSSPEWLAYEIGLPPKYLPILSIPEGKVPIISWNAVKKWQKSYNIRSLISSDAANNPTQAIEYISSPVRPKKKQFALRVKGDSMVSPIAGKLSFLESDIIIADPEKKPESGNFVVALQNASEAAIFKQYIIDGNKQYLRPLNPQYPLITLDDTFKIYGVVIAQLNILILS